LKVFRRLERLTARTRDRPAQMIVSKTNEESESGGVRGTVLVNGVTIIRTHSVRRYFGNKEVDAYENPCAR
jgi:hypothetical protein